MRFVEFGISEQEPDPSGKFKNVVRAIGADRALLNLRAQPSILTITGSHTAYQQAIRALHERVDASVLPTSCPVCFNVPTEPHFTSCGHCYCHECFKAQVQATGTGNILFRCSEQGCGHVLTLTELRRAISHEEFEQLLQASARSHVNSRPQALFFCPTQGCPQLHTVLEPADDFTTTSPSAWHCPECLVLLCMACKVPFHSGKTCKEAEGARNAGLKEWMKKAGAVPCPACGIGIERDGGCMRVQCTNCGKHVCFRCFRAFDSAITCYSHVEEGEVAEREARELDENFR
ncbi:uncharacterized protein K452DRAFT_284417 [Aplosporella prunicola CBS 121167]|uniref:RING-type domain-containing protein n=1 Tax=Aplosporella prunicola CBS 121167 TaxID=1176127 RepID=A0A6A6BP72_9PEZI|nr:uncharacterized protein K452DRAFT_284417 [Aplosporella prunicola CBS 121167]KAF2145024.1 hypothetical protein K452DRAFT_284417 [Aplosporella prunicola CBS 121167]